MFARVATARMRSGALTDERLALILDSLRFVKEMPGFLGISIALNDDRTLVASTSYWDTRAHLEAAEERARNITKASDALTAGGVEAVEMEGMEVVHLDGVSLPRASTGGGYMGHRVAG